MNVRMRIARDARVVPVGRETLPGTCVCVGRSDMRPFSDVTVETKTSIVYIYKVVY